MSAAAALPFHAEVRGIRGAGPSAPRRRVFAHPGCSARFAGGMT